MKGSAYLSIVFVILIILTLACNLPINSQTADSKANTAADPKTPTNPASENQEPNLPQTEPTESPTMILTPLPSNTPTITSTATPSVPMVQVSTNTNCRTGPGVVYDLLNVLLVEDQAEVVGKYTSSSPPHWIIKKNGVTCWLWGEYATVKGNTKNLPEMIPPPTPTPTSTITPSPTPEPTGDLAIVEIFMSTQFEIVIRVNTNPIGSLNGNFQYTLYADGAQSTQGSCSIPEGNNACYTGHTVVGSQSIQAVIDSNNNILETNEGNNSLTSTCDKAAFTCN